MNSELKENIEPENERADGSEGDRRVQLEWERLQNEAIAAQRWRLEQEMEQAKKERSATVIQPESGFMQKMAWIREYLLVGLLILSIGCAGILFTWWQLSAKH